MSRDYVFLGRMWAADLVVWRIRHGWGLEQAAAALGLTRGTVWDLESGLRPISQDVLKVV